MLMRTPCFWTRVVTPIAAALLLASAGRAQFLDNFDGPKIDGWFTMAGDGFATVKFVPHGGFARLEIDGTKDPYGVWWTLIKRDISPSLDLAKLKDPAYELRVEARVRVSDAPRRVNFMINTQRTTNFHEHLREYDIGDTNEWHVISMTTRHFDAGPGDQVFVQFAATDWGPVKCHVDLDYYRADVVRREDAGPDVGEPLVYHPPVPEIGTLAQHQTATHDSVINFDFPDVNFNDWRMEEAGGSVRVLTVDGKDLPVLRWDLAALRGQQADGPGVLELTTASVVHGGKYIEHWGQDFGEEFGAKVHVIEILAGDPAWEQEKVTANSLLRGGAPDDVFNRQMIQDIDLAEKPGGKNYVVLPRPVMQRLLDGRTKGIVIRPLGALAATFYASEDPQGRGPKLHFTTKPGR
jgi:hypothetical protein